jgi:hypothetical protein
VLPSLHSAVNTKKRESVMRLFIAGIVAFGLLAGSAAFAQDKKVRSVLGNQRVEAEDPITKPGQERAAVALTPEMRAYLDELQRRDEPKQNAKRAAMVKAEQRRARLASQAWYGVSNLRPTANPFPITSSYSPHWAGSYNDFVWYGASAPIYVEQPLIYRR